ncbi:helix-turn-helix domain-containing protein [Prosthecochloris sp.]|uniref:helix-turn-helix domain-containing protein n=1 Tax=Prosthecochloris sp. TaxID=290513 RepID=UPI0025F42622|nr:helix-turn-helix domain-containing protein [Prosthecochloris sp.]
MADGATFGSASDLLVSKLILARKEKGLSLEELSAETRIKKDHLEKIEAGNLTFLPAAYVYAFLKEYAQALDIYDSDLIERCRDELSIPTDLKISQVDEPVEDEQNDGNGERLSGMFGAVTAAGGKAPATAFLIGGAVLIVLVLFVISFFMFSGPSGDEQTGSQKGNDASAPVVESQPEFGLAEADSVVQADTLATVTADERDVSSDLAVMQEKWAQGVSFLPESSTSPYQKILIVRITDDLSWVKIIADDGDMVYPGGQFKAGEVLRYEAKRKFWVNIGRPPFVELYLNGEKVPPFRKRTVVLGE